MNQYRVESERSQQQVDRLTAKNEELQAGLIKKNLELEEAYRRLQEELKRSGIRGGKNPVASIDRL